MNKIVKTVILAGISSAASAAVTAYISKRGNGPVEKAAKKLDLAVKEAEHKLG